jgi:predicted nucleic acid-binding protein
VIYVDTNVLVAASLEAHPHHAPAEDWLRRVHAGELKACIATHGVAEMFVVLTRVPISPPVQPHEAWRLIQGNVLPYFKLVALSARDYRQALADCAKAGWTGGRVYDSLHLMAARRARCNQICTFNLRHFRETAPDFGSSIHMP